MVRWESGRRSDNVEDRRRMSPAMAAGGGGISLVVLLIAWAILGDFGKALRLANNVGGPVGAPMAAQQRDLEISPEEEELADYVRVILGYTEDVWSEVFAEEGRTYTPPTLVLFRGEVDSACGVAGASAGPFYCPGDQKVYIDLEFYNELKHRFGAPGDFAQAYVIAHEVGHHVQNLLGVTEQVHALHGRVSQEEYNQASVRLELQADYLAGVWAARAHRQWKILEPGDLEEGLNAANAIGDDTLQRKAQGYVVKDAFTHGSSEQRVRWLRKGLEAGDLSEWDTFSARNL